MREVSMRYIKVRKEKLRVQDKRWSQLHILAVEVANIKYCAGSEKRVGSAAEARPHMVQ
jgi:hypothetical protein